VTQLPRTADVRRASGLPHIGVIRDPTRLARVREVIAGAAGSAVLPGLVRLAGRVVASDCAQLSLLADRQVATAVRCTGSTYAEHVSELEDSLCTVTVLSGDVLVAADARAHPWLHDLPPVVSGAVGAYLGVPLLLADDPPAVRGRDRPGVRRPLKGVGALHLSKQRQQHDGEVGHRVAVVGGVDPDRVGEVAHPDAAPGQLMNEVEGVPDGPPQPVQGVHDDHVTVAGVRQRRVEPRPVSRRAGLLVQVDPLRGDPGLVQRIELPVQVLLRGRDPRVPKIHTRRLVELVPHQATLALLMVSALATMSRSRGWVAACRFRQPM